MLYLLVLGFGMVAGVALAAVGVAAVVDSHMVGWIAVALGLSGALMSWTALQNMRPYRGDPGDAISAEGGLYLPLRPGYAKRAVITPVLLGGTVLVGTIAYRSMMSVTIGAIVFALGCLYAWWLHRSRFLHLTIRIDPQGVGTADGRTHIAWRDITLVDTVGGSFPGVAVAGPNTAPAALRMQASSWRPEQLKALIDKAVGSTGFRARLSDPTTVRPFIRSS
ncbi:hypothetical protein FB381_2864 [Nocardioides albertanoniae]|uniref:PH (Pleckstrin Homology) domain-containing protein n=1 Tax=Nocardioides albertanoniae TaxID=1175486 RepID=A0A543A8N4_9ACTN|nr:hypothetical protein [Nocardioides albertanoniae]TQL68963.1 hypothetical protein FB381_2864 [Nocardioides albertanoniae]